MYSLQLTFPVEVFKVLALGIVRQCLILFTLQLVQMMTRISLVKGFSHFSPAQKSAKVTRQSSARVLGSVSSSELSAHQMPRAGVAAHSRPSEERTSFVDAYGHA